MDTLSSLSPPPPTRDQPRGGPRGPGSTSLWPRERENKAWSRQAYGRERGRGRGRGGVEDPGRWARQKETDAAPRVEHVGFSNVNRTYN